MRFINEDNGCCMCADVEDVILTFAENESSGCSLEGRDAVDGDVSALTAEFSCRAGQKRPWDSHSLSKF
jgi:hypothetical protein